MSEKRYKEISDNFIQSSQGFPGINRSTVFLPETQATKERSLAI
jgi:hypothetical protein